MNIFQSINNANISIRTFKQPYNEPYPFECIEIPVFKIVGNDPIFNQYAPFNSGYDIEFILTTPADLRYIADGNLMVEVFAPSLGLQIGDKEGFKITSIIPPGSLELCLYSYKFKTVKPNKEPFKRIEL